jgi:hypothetical protein
VQESDIVAVVLVIVDIDVSLARVCVDKNETGVGELGDGADLREVEVVKDSINFDSGVDGLGVVRAAPRIMVSMRPSQQWE